MEEQKDLGSYSEGGTADAAQVPCAVGHTPGPWTIIPPVPYDGDDEEFEGAFTVPASIEGSDGNPVCMFGDSYGSGSLYENDADYRLISAAPELLSSLEEISDMLMARPDIVAKLHPLMGFAEKATFDRARAAIAKALGQ